MISINPYRKMDESLPTPRKIYERGVCPHVYGIASFAYEAMVCSRKNQSVIMSGDSGAGKTYTAKRVLSYLTELSTHRNNLVNTRSRNLAPDVANSSEVVGIESKVLACNPFLEAFGNAKTLRNDNSSRFGKFLKIKFRGGKILGAFTEHYLLEKSRVTKQSDSDRNYHIFYNLLSGATAQERKEFGLLDVTRYEYLGAGRTGACTTVNGVDDKDIFNGDHDEGVRKAFDVALDNGSGNTASRALQAKIYRLVAAVLAMGNIPAKGNKAAEDNCSKLLGLDHLKGTPMSLHRVLSVYCRCTKDGVIESPLEAEDMRNSRDTLAKMIYSLLFDFIIAHVVNKSLATKDGDDGEYYIGLLDIFGFEIFKVNSFEQLLINYANEKLQMLFNTHIYNIEVEEYKHEQIQTGDFFHMPDNSPTVDLVEMRLNRTHLKKTFNGILARLEDRCGQKDAKHMDRTWGVQLTAQFATKRDKKQSANAYEAKCAQNFYSSKRTAQEMFGIKHFAGVVQYSYQGFIEKNRDKLPPHLRVLMRLSSNQFLSSLFGGPIDVKRKSEAATLYKYVLGKAGAKARKASDNAMAANVHGAFFPSIKKGVFISSKFKKNLRELWQELTSTKESFVRCVKPNMHHYQCGDKLAFNASLVLKQLRFAGVIEAVKIRNNGFPFRMEFDRFWDYCKKNRIHCFCDAPATLPAIKGTIRVMTTIFGNTGVGQDLPPCDDSLNPIWAVGTTKIFGKKGTRERIDRWLTEKIVPMLRHFIRQSNALGGLHDFRTAVNQLQLRWRQKYMMRKLEKWGPAVSMMQRLAKALLANERARALRVEFRRRQERERAAKLVLTHWRSHFSRRIIQRMATQLVAANRLKRAAITLQQAYRLQQASKLWRSLATKVSDTFVLRQLGAADTWDQCSALIGKIQDPRVLPKVVPFAARYIQGLVRCLQAQAALRRRRQQYSNFVKVFSKMWLFIWCKIRLRRFRANIRHNRLVKAASKIAAVWKCHVMRRQYLRLRHATITLQLKFLKRWVFEDDGLLFRWASAADKAAREGGPTALRKLLACKPPYHRLSHFSNLLNGTYLPHNSTLLHTCSSMGLHKAVKALLECGARTHIVNIFGETPLHSSVRQGDRTLSISKMLVAASKDPEALLQSRNMDGDSVLDAAISSDEEVCGPHIRTLLWLVEELGVRDTCSAHWTDVLDAEIGVYEDERQQMLELCGEFRDGDQDQDTDDSGVGSLAEHKRERKSDLASVNVAMNAAMVDSSEDEDLDFFAASGGASARKVLGPRSLALNNSLETAFAPHFQPQFETSAAASTHSSDYEHTRAQSEFATSTNSAAALPTNAGKDLFRASMASVSAGYSASDGRQPWQPRQTQQTNRYEQYPQRHQPISSNQTQNDSARTLTRQRQPQSQPHDQFQQPATKPVGFEGQRGHLQERQQRTLQQPVQATPPWVQSNRAGSTPGHRPNQVR